MKKSYAVALLLVSFLVSANSFDKDKMNALFDHIEKNNQGMGSVSLFQNGKEVFHRSIGFASIADNIKASHKTKYRIGSISKTFTATMIMQLVEQGKLSVENKLSDFFPSIQNAGKITIENLLQHRSGIFNITSDENFGKWMLKETNQKEMIDRIAQYEPQFKPGKKMQYSNSNYILLSYIAEKVSNKSYSKLLKDTIATTCDLHDTYYGGKIKPTKNEANSYEMLDEWQLSVESDMSFPQGAGGIVSTPTDLNKFYSCLFNAKLVNANSLKAMTNLKQGYGYGLGQVPFDSKKAYSHSGRIDEFYSMTAYFSEDKLTYSYISNGQVMPTNDIAIGILSIYFGKNYKLPEFKPTLQHSSEELDMYLGTYSVSTFPLKITIFKKSKTLFAQATGQGAFPIKATKKDVFTFDTAGIVLEFNPKKEGMTLKQGGGVYTMQKEKQ